MCAQAMKTGFPYFRNEHQYLILYDLEYLVFLRTCEAEFTTGHKYAGLHKPGVYASGYANLYKDSDLGEAASCHDEISILPRAVSNGAKLTVFLGPYLSYCRTLAHAARQTAFPLTITCIFGLIHRSSLKSKSQRMAFVEMP